MSVRVVNAPRRHVGRFADSYFSGAQRPHQLVRLLLVSGGDERIWPDPATARNRYGTSVTPAPDEICFSSSTATTISAASYDAALQALCQLVESESRAFRAIDEWFFQLRTELLEFFGSANAEVVLAASGTEGELIALAIAERVMARAITNVVVAPNETGSGVTKAAAGRHFLPSSSLGGPLQAGRRLEGWEDSDIEVVAVEIRSPEGMPRTAVDVDADAAVAAERALARGRAVLLHVLDASKTGLTGVSREAAWEIVRLAPERIIVVVDACQLRCPAKRLRSDLDRGFMVLTTGSKFVGGPPFSGALFLPEAILHRLRNARQPPKGLAHYSAQHDWPQALRGGFARDLRFANVGLGLRWTAALAELRELAAVDDAVQEAIQFRFAAEVIRRAQDCPFASVLDQNYDRGRTPSIVPLLPRKPGGKVCSATEAAKLHCDLRTSFHSGSVGRRHTLERIVHVGQAVALGDLSVLRVCASASHVAGAARRLARDGTMERAFEPIMRDLDRLFSKWNLLMDHGYSES